jgi:oligopeptide transport system ATP-binding protein
MIDLQNKINTSIIMITHDLGVVAHIAQRVIVMYGGKVVEYGKAGDVFYNSKHPYTWGLLSSVPRLDIRKKGNRLQSIEGTPPDLFAPPSGCPFADRCEYSMKICRAKMPNNFEISEGHASACWLNHPDAPKISRPGQAANTKDLVKQGGAK